MRLSLPTVVVGVAAAGAGLVPGLAAATPPAARTAKATTSAKATASAQAKLKSATLSGNKITVKGTVALKPDTAAERAKVRVVVKLEAAGGVERYVVSITRSGAFSKSWTTKLTGAGKLVARAEISGRYSGSAATRALTLPAAATPGSTTVTVTTPAPSTGIGTTAPTANEIPLVGTFTIGSGSQFKMENGLVGSASLSAGSDGGLQTFGYQPAPSPAFAGGTSGGALAARIIKPVGFDGTNFSVDTQPTDVQNGAADPVPTIYVNAAGQLSGQVTAWDAQWNGQSFNQGTPKPDGSTPGSTSKLSGTYNWATGAYSLTWTSLIVGGPFNGFSGTWTLTGTFEPAKF